MMKTVHRVKSGNFSQRLFLLSLLVKRNIKNKYYRSVIGILWSVLNPLLNTLVMYLVFSVLFTNSSDMEGLPYILYILSGNIVFGLMTEATNGSISSIVGQSGLLLSTPVPMEIFPLSKAFTALVSFLFSSIALLAVMIICCFTGAVRYEFHWQLILIITILPAELIFSIGISFFLSTLYVFFRDTQYIYSVFSTLWRFLTPIFYSVSRFDSGSAYYNLVMKVVEYNPMYQYLTAFRQMMTGVIPDAKAYLMMYGFAFISLAIGWIFMHALKNRISSQL
ncbi:MAG: ABC transporter permease [Clostridia bacterium]|nr:ABC transporter permease [Clostridia bacterium]